MHDNTRNKLKRRAQEDDKLYERFARNLGKSIEDGLLPSVSHHQQVDGVIHHVQAFCHFVIGDIIFRNAIGLPILPLEGRR